MSDQSRARNGDTPRFAWQELVFRHAMLLTALLLIVAFSLTSPVFGTPANAVNILRQSASVLLLGTAMVLVVLVGGIDLSVGSVVLASATLSGIALVLGVDPFVALLAGIAIGAAVGTANAVLIEGLRISPVIVTLGSMIAVRGLSLLALGRFNSWVEIKGSVFDALARASVLGIPLDAIVALAVAALVWFVLARTTLGRAWHAIGDAPVAARLAGLPVAGCAIAYIACGALAGLAGTLVAARTGLISPSIGAGLEFYAIAVVALAAGGLPAGRVSVLHALVGTLILMMIFNYMTIRGVPGTWQTTVTGLLLLAAIVAGRLLQRQRIEISSGEAFRDEYAGISPAGARIVRGAVAAAALLLAAVFALINPRFATLPNLITLVEQNAVLAIVAIGATFGIVSRNIDISPGSVIVLGAVVAALAFQSGVPVPLALLAGMLASIAVYLLNGVLVGGLQLDPLIVTLAAWIWARGLAISLTNASSIGFDAGFVTFMNTPVLLGFTPGALLLVPAFLLGWLLLARTALGLRIYAVGGDPRMLRQAGVGLARLHVAIFGAMAVFTALGMVVMLGRLGAAPPPPASPELDAIVAVIIGGASSAAAPGGCATPPSACCSSPSSTMACPACKWAMPFFLIKGLAILGALTLRALAQSRFARRRRRRLALRRLRPSRSPPLSRAATSMPFAPIRRGRRSARSALPSSAPAASPRQSGCRQSAGCKPRASRCTSPASPIPMPARATRSRP